MHALKEVLKKFDKEKHQAAQAHFSVSSVHIEPRCIYRYRRQDGVNLGSWFVLEKWIAPSPFQDAIPPGSSDYDVARGLNARQILEQHWDTWITDEDWKWMAQRGINSVRIPIGYYHLYSLDNDVVKGTPFEGVGSVFEGAWSRIITAIKTAGDHGLGVLIDLHSAPGKQNSDSHSGINGPVEFFKKANLERTITILKVLAITLSDIPNVVGLELVNEPKNDHTLYKWYQKALDTIREAIGPELPLYIGDAWNTNQYAGLIERREDFIVLDHHVYRCFTSQDHQLSGDEHAATFPPKHLIACSQKTRGNLVVGEFSAALNPQSLRSTAPSEQDRQRHVFICAELDAFPKCCGGSWFWTYKKDGWDTGWSLRDAVRAGIMPDRVGIPRSQLKPNDVERKNSDCANALGQHEAYWRQYNSAKGFEHWRFELGFKQGWDDAFLFFEFVPEGLSASETIISQLGFAGQWIKMRASGHTANHANGNLKNIWEYEHGFQQGLVAAGAYALRQ